VTFKKLAAGHGRHSHVYIVTAVDAKQSQAAS
jgi:hypothetical protein